MRINRLTCTEVLQKSLRRELLIIYKCLLCLGTMGSEGQHGGSPIYHASLALNHISYIYFGVRHINLPAAETVSFLVDHFNFI